jgi:hypothetical protein
MTDPASGPFTTASINAARRLEEALQAVRAWLRERAALIARAEDEAAGRQTMPPADRPAFLLALKLVRVQDAAMKFRLLAAQAALKAADGLAIAAWRDGREVPPPDMSGRLRLLSAVDMTEAALEHAGD